MAVINGDAGDNVLESLSNGDEVHGLEGVDTLSAAHNNVVLDGGSGDDSLTSSGNNNTLLGGVDADMLVSTADAVNTTMDGGSGADLLIGAGKNDTASYASAPADVAVDLSTLSASDGDLIFGIENVTGSAFNDSLTGDEFANALQGGMGNDTLAGGAGADTFKYAFTLTQGQGSQSTFTDFLSTKYGKDFGDELPDYTPRNRHHHRRHDEDDKHRWKDDDHCRNGRDDRGDKDDGNYSKRGDHDHHHHRHGGDDGYQAQGGGLAENFFEKNYKEWLRELVDTHNLGSDVNGNGKIKIELNDDSPYGTPRIEGMTTEQLAELFGDRDSVILNDNGRAEKAWYSNSFNSDNGKDGVASTDGNDTIVDFTFGEDKLEFNGITKDQFLASFVIDDTQNVDGVGGADTVITIADNTDWSLTLLEVSGHGLQAFADDIFG